MILWAVPSCSSRTIAPLSYVGKSRVTVESTPLTTTVYTHPSDEEMRDRLRGLGC